MDFEAVGAEVAAVPDVKIVNTTAPGEGVALPNWVVADGCQDCVDHGCVYDWMGVFLLLVSGVGGRVCLLVEVLLQLLSH